MSTVSAAVMVLTASEALYESAHTVKQLKQTTWHQCSFWSYLLATIFSLILGTKYPFAAGVCQIGSWCAFSSSILSERNLVHNLLKASPLCLPDYSKVEKWGALSLSHLKHHSAVPLFRAQLPFLCYYYSKLLQTTEEIFFVLLYS